MTIKFPCPHCKKMLSVKEHLAGKKAACPACKQPLTIPTASTVPAAPDVEALAAAAFSDEPAKKEEQAPQVVEFRCYYCDEQVKVNAELAGKQAPCPNPECRRIIKVPQLVKTQPKDWRTIDTRTPLVAQQQQQAPEGAWGSTTSQGRVSRQSLEDAAALPTVAAPAGAKRWIVRGAAAAVALTVGLGAWFGVSAFSTMRQEAQAVAKAEELLKQLAGVPAAEGARGLGEYYLLTRNVEKANVRFVQARAALNQQDEQTSRERDFVLADLAASQVGLGGSKEEVEERARLKWEDAAAEIVRSLLQIRGPEVRVEAVRAVTRRLIAKGQGKAAVGLAAQVGAADEIAELTAAVGLELLAAKQTEEANAAADLVQRQLFAQTPAESAEPAGDAGKAKESAARKVPLTPAVIALYVALNRQDEKAKFPPPQPTSAGAREVVAAGYAEGLGLRGELDKARAVVKTTSTHGQVQARVGLAASLAGDQAEAARAELEEAVNLVAKNPDRKADFQPHLFRLVRVGARLGMTDALKPAAEALSDRDTKGRAQLEILRARLTATSGTVSESLAQEVDKESPAHALALAAVARHNARVDGPRSVRGSVDGWGDEKHRAFGYVGLALGARDGRR